MAKVRKSSLVAADRGTNYLGRQFVKNSEFVDGNSATYIAKGDIVTLSGVAGAYPTVERARDGVTDEAQLFVAAQEIREFGAIELWQIQTSVDTDAAATPSTCRTLPLALGRPPPPPARRLR
jgi:hypothetical protein